MPRVHIVSVPEIKICRKIIDEGMKKMEIYGLWIWFSRYDNRAILPWRVNMQNSLIMITPFPFFSLGSQTICRPDTSRRQQRRLLPCPLVIALVPLKFSSRNIQFPNSMTGALQGDNALAPSKTKHIGLNLSSSIRIKTYLPFQLCSNGCVFISTTVFFFPSPHLFRMLSRWNTLPHTSSTPWPMWDLTPKSILLFFSRWHTPYNPKRWWVDAEPKSPAISLFLLNYSSEMLYYIQFPRLAVWQGIFFSSDPEGLNSVVTGLRVEWMADHERDTRQEVQTGIHRLAPVRSEVWSP